MRLATLLSTVLVASLLLSNPAHGEALFDWATVGNPGNASDPSNDDGQFGAVAKAFRISKHEVTNNQYAEFLNAVDAIGVNPNGVYNPSMGDADPAFRGGIDFDATASSGAKYSSKSEFGGKPVNYVSYFDAMRFVNWLENGMPTDGSGTESGVYAIGSGLDELRSPTATYFIPNEDEWYKAAYHHPADQGGDADGYWLFGTASNSIPTIAKADAQGNTSNPGANVANYNRGADWNGQNGHVTTVGSAGPGSASYYGTFDQSGNVLEWNQSVIDSSSRGLRGGSWFFGSNNLGASARGYNDPSLEDQLVGFRVASVVPEPNAALLGAAVYLVLLLGRPRYES